MFIRYIVLFIVSWVLSFPAELYAEEFSRVAVVISRKLNPYEEAVQGIEQSFKEKSMETIIDYYDLDGNPGKGKKIAGEIIDKRTELVFTVGTEATQVTLKHAKELPVITSMVYDPVREGIVQEPDRPRVYGAQLTIPWQLRFELLRDIVPRWNRISIIYWVNGGEKLLAGVEEAARTTGHQTLFVPLESLSNFKQAIDRARKGSDMLVMILDRRIYNKATGRELFLYSARHKFPVITFSPNYVKLGALISFSSDFYQNGKDAGDIGINLLDKEQIAKHFVTPSSIKVTWNQHVAQAMNIQLSERAKKRINRFI